MSLSPVTALERAWQRVADREAARLRGTFEAAPTSVPDARSGLAAVLAGLVLLGYAALALAGLWWLARATGLIGPPLMSLLRLIVGVMGAAALGFVWISRPSFGPSPGHGVTQERAPQLHALIADVAGLVGVPAPARTTVIPAVNAFMGLSGFPPRPALGLGLALWYALDPQERLAVLAHELAHQKNRDPARSHLIGTALSVLEHSVRLLTPDLLMRAREEAGGLNFLTNLLMRVLALVPLGLHQLLVSLIGAEHQRAEFRADLLAAQVCGTEAATRALDSVQLLNRRAMLETALHRQRYAPQTGHAFLELRRLWRAESPARLAEARKTYRDDHARLDATHPPTADRLAVLQAHPCPPQLILTAQRAAQIDEELTPFALSM
ncbi:M48 family metallopeptidase [Deinococcus hohokamensis]|uniref:M48 family metallopeptidase n=1 Tax=Deinococcus hohokamensis TaxID=309883 RepID=A0ABV9IA84_9DEIO